jgi:hypothetical protein
LKLIMPFLKLVDSHSYLTVNSGHTLGMSSASSSYFTAAKKEPGDIGNFAVG